MVTIRKATASDVADVLGLIQALADYERAPNEVRCSVEDLLRDGFGPQPRFHIFLALRDEKIIGFALYFFTWSTWTGKSTLYLEDLFVRQEFRNQGAGLALFKALAREAVNHHCSRMDWAVLDWNESARSFYRKIGAEEKTDWLTCRLSAEPLEIFAQE